ncbi:MAG: transglycosylase family protein [Acidimicrobiia bacterium]
MPDPHGLPTIEVLLEEAAHVDRLGNGDVVYLDALEAQVSLSPARAEPHDPAAWLPLPDDVHVLPSVEDLRDPHPDVQAAVIAEAEALVRDALAAAVAAVAPSPARAEPHDPSSWLPLPIVEELAPAHGLLEPAAPPAGRTRRRRLTRLLPAPRVVFIALLVTATVLVGGWAGSNLMAPGGSQVSLLVDGTRSHFRTEVKTVGAVLGVHHVHLGPGDTVVPPPGTALHDGLRIDILRSFPVSVDLDGTARTVRTTERTAQGLATQLKLGKLVAVRSDPGRLLAGSKVVYRTRMSGSLAVDGQNVRFDSPSRTVAELMDSYNVHLLGDDYVVPAGSTVLSDGATVTVVRVGAATVQESKRIKFDTVQRGDDTLPIGQSRLVQAGKDGVMTVTYRERVENGAASGRTLLSEVPSIAPTPRIVAFGTHADPHWDTLAECESGGRWDTVDQAPNGYDGGLGIYRGTWRAFGGTEFAPNAGLATREQQIIVGMRIYAALGWDPWGCANNVLHWPNRT